MMKSELIRLDVIPMQKVLSGLILASSVWSWNTFNQYFSTPQFPQFSLETHVSQKRKKNSPFFQSGTVPSRVQVITKQKKLSHNKVQYIISKRTNRPIHSHHPISVFVQSHPVQTHPDGHSGYRVQAETVYYYNRWGKVIHIQHNTFTQGYGIYEKRLDE